jgi:hypothetical protein
LGAPRVYLRKAGDYSSASESFDILIVELPSGDLRAEVLAYCDRVARAAGFRGAFDDGQKYVNLGVPM